MPKQITIRKNNITNNWEHWVQLDNSSGYWADGVYGNYENSSIFITSTSNIDDQGNFIFYEEFANKRIPIELAIKTYNTQDLTSYDDIEITELLEIQSELPELTGSNIFCQEFPIATQIYESTFPTLINGDFQFNNIFYDAQFTFSVSASNPCGSDPMNYYWIVDEKQESVGINMFSPNFIDEQFTEQIKAKSILCKVENMFGSTISNALSLTLFNPTKSKIFGQNLIKNNFGRDGLNEWIVTRGQPKIYPAYEQFGKTGFFNINDIKDLNEYDLTLPTKNNLLYFTGGEATPDNNISSMFQLIDVSEIADYIDGNIYDTMGVTTSKVYACIYGLFGKWGTSGCWKQLTNPPLSYFEYINEDYIPTLRPWEAIDQMYPCAISRYWQDELHYSMSSLDYCIGDRVKMIVTFLDEKDNRLENEIVLKTDDFIEFAQKTWIRGELVFLPVKTRKIKIEIIFEKDFDINIKSYEGVEDVEMSLPYDVRPINPKTLFNLRPWETPNFKYDGINSKGTPEFHLDHLSMATLFSCELGLTEKLPINTTIYDHRDEFSPRFIQRPDWVATEYRLPTGSQELPDFKLYFYKSTEDLLTPSQFAVSTQINPRSWQANIQYISGSVKDINGAGWCTSENGQVFKCKQTHFSSNNNMPILPGGHHEEWIDYWEYVDSNDFVCCVQQQVHDESNFSGFIHGNGVYDIGFPDNITSKLQNASNCPTYKYFKTSLEGLT